MDATARRILKTYDELQRESADLHALFELAGGNAPADREAVLDSVQQLIEQGFLKPGEGGDFYVRTEAGRLAVAEPSDVTLYTRPNCHLCDEAKAVIVPLVREFGATLREVDIDRDSDLRERYTNDVPVIFIGSRKVAKHHVDAKQFRRQLEQARS